MSDVKAALEYANLLKAYADEATEDLHILMRVYFEKVSLSMRMTLQACDHGCPRAADMRFSSSLEPLSDGRA